MTGQIVLISGTSGAGKTTTCQAFARRAEESTLMLGLDLLLGSLIPAKYTIFGEKKKEGYYGNGFGPVGMKAVRALHAMIAGGVRSGQNIVVDHLMFIDPPILQDCIWQWDDLPVLFVNLRPSKEALDQRLRERKIELPPPLLEAIGDDGARELAETLSSMIPWYYERSYQNDIYDLDLDSTQLSPDEVCQRIEARLREGPGTAFEKLRQRYPRKD